MQLSLDLARAARDEALSRVETNAGVAWNKAALHHIANLPDGEYIGEDIRVSCEAVGIQPHHPNAWGALIRTAIARGLLIQTGRLRAMTGEKSHARRSEILTRGHP